MSDEREIQQVFARYVRAADDRNGAAMSAIFLPDGKVEIFYNNAGTPELIGELAGQAAIGEAMTTMMTPHPPRGWSHHTTHDPIVEVHGDTGTLDVQFVVFNVVGDEKPQSGWPEGAAGAQGTITPIESGYYRPILQKVAGRWMMAHHRIYHDLPMAF
jgi:SnoaL-like domain